jgi:hypothetical protein
MWERIGYSWFLSSVSAKIFSLLAVAGTEFEVVWRGLKDNLSEQAAYVRILDPGSLPKIFKHSLTGPLLASLATAALHGVVPPPPFTTIYKYTSAPPTPSFPHTVSQQTSLNMFVGPSGKRQTQFTNTVPTLCLPIFD